MEPAVSLPKPDGTVEYFRAIKNLSEKYWSDIEINPNTYGYQIQKNSKWKQGLTEQQLKEFEKELAIEFPIELKNFYRVMNGLDKPGINVFGSNGDDPGYNPVYYSYPDDLEEIRENINWIYESNGLDEDRIRKKEIPGIFPIVGHRFLILDKNNQILSMYGDDIIFWTDNISKLIATDIFPEIQNDSEFETDANNTEVKFWLEQ